MTRHYTRHMTDTSESPYARADATWRGPIRLITGLLLIATLLFVAVTTLTLNTDGASAIQVTQVYTEAIFECIAAIGVAFGVYLITQSDA